jgi:transcriptional regulator with XRE-family HTH domain
MAKRFENLSDMVKKLSSDDKFKEEMLEELKDRNIAKFLFTLRCEHSLTQKQMAERIKCSQSRISKIENSKDNEISISDLLDYGKALDLQLEIGYRDKSTKLVDLIRYHTFKIKDYLDKLVDLVKDDEDIAKGVLKCHIEAFVNICNVTLSNMPLLHKKIGRKRIRESRDIVYISSPLKDKMPAETTKDEVCA